MCEIEISHMGKDNGDPDLVCENKTALMGAHVLAQNHRSIRFRH